MSTSEAVDAILDSVGKAISEIDLEFYTRGDTSDVDIGFACTDPLGYRGVKPGESRTFDRIIFSFDTIVYSDCTLTDRIGKHELKAKLLT